MPRVAPWLILPVCLTSSMAGLALAIAHDVPILVALAVGGLVFGGAILALERWMPEVPAWQRPHGDLVTDLLHLVVTGWIVGSIPQLVIREPAVALWPTEWPLAAQVALALLSKDFIVYWWHRALHAVLWRIHAVHHSAPRLYWLNTWRAHPVEGLVSATAGVVPLVLVGAPQVVVVSSFAFTSVFAMLQHSNIELRGGILNWIFATAELHRWHHSPVTREANSNFGNLFIVWDVIFGTRYLPAHPPPVDVGLGGSADFPAGYVAQLAAPFERERWSSRRGPSRGS